MPENGTAAVNRGITRGAGNNYPLNKRRRSVKIDPDTSMLLKSLIENNIGRGLSRSDAEGRAKKYLKIG